MSEIIATVKTNFKGMFSREEINKIINRHYIGSDNCNEVINGEILPKTCDGMNKVIEAQYNLITSWSLEIAADVTNDGKLINFRVVED